ncbi:MAG: phosphorylase family protein [bacterium]
MRGDLKSRIVESARAIERWVGGGRIPERAVAIGEGLGLPTPLWEDELPFEEIPNFPRRRGAKLSRSPRALFLTMLRASDGHSIEELVLPIRAMRSLGIREVLLLDVALGLREDFRSGEVAFLADHINLTGDNPLIGPNDESLGPRFPDMTRVYREVPKGYRSGVFVGLPNFDDLDVEFLRYIGGDMAGDSIVPEAIAARHCGMEVVGAAIMCDLLGGRIGTGHALPVLLNSDEAADRVAEIVDMFIRDEI